MNRKSEESIIDVLRLSMVSGVGPRTRTALLERFGSSSAVLSAAPSELQAVPGVGSKIAYKIASANNEIDAEAELARCREHGISIVTESDDEYPRLLREIHNPPSLLFYIGSFKPEDALTIAVVGTRHASNYGLQQAKRLGANLANAGLTVVSGLARGVDAAAHRGALEAGGRTLAVLGSGVLNLYPPEHRQLADAVIEHGALISESPPTAAPLAGAFPQRNRIISGLSLGVVVVEAAQRSGALITSRLAMEQGREVFAVPGRIDSRNAQGCHRLIRDGAKLVESVDDVLEELGPLVEAIPRDNEQTVRHPAELMLNDLEQQVLASIDVGPTSIDAIIRETSLPVARVLSTVSVLERRHLVQRLDGATVKRL